MNAAQLMERFDKLKREVEQNPGATGDRISGWITEWESIYDTACSESGSQATVELTDEQYDEICSYYGDYITDLTNWGDSNG